MDNEQFWQTYVGDVSTVEFCRRRKGRPIVEFVDNYVARLPHFYGIVLRGTWRETFAALPHLRRDDVSAGLIGYLEARRDEWENAVYAPEPEPEPPPPQHVQPTEEATAEAAAAPAPAMDDPAPDEPVATNEAGAVEPPPPAEAPVPEVFPCPESPPPDNLP